jgi:hypothetical protein
MVLTNWRKSILIPGWLVALLTFPGVMLHEWAHKVFCDCFHIPVFEIRYFQVGKGESGYVKHGEPKSFSQSFWISTGPLIINSCAAVLFATLITQATEGSILRFVLGWLSISAGMHAFPSIQDADHIEDASRVARANGGSVLYFLAYPFVWLIGIANVSRFFWFDALYAFILFQLGTRAISI